MNNDENAIDSQTVAATPAMVEPAPTVIAVGPVTGPVVEVAAVAAPEGERFGRFTRAELEAMRGRRGRKPSEYHTLFPQEQGAAQPAQTAKAPSAAAAKPQRRGPKIPAVSSAIIGEHTIDELLAMIGSTGRKPVAFDILQQAAQVFADLRAIDLPPALDQDPLAVALADAPKQVRETIAALLAAIRPRQAKAAKAVAATSA